MSEHPVYTLFPRLTEELEILEPLLKASPTEAVRRLYVRSSFAMLEALSCLIRDKASQGIVGRFMESGHLELTKAHFLEDYSYRLSGTGKLERADRNDLSFGPQFAFGLRTLAEVAGVERDYIQGSGWDAFRKALKIRNRITHPKDHEHITVTEDDLQTVNLALEWAFDSLVDICKRSEVMVDPLAAESST